MHSIVVAEVKFLTLAHKRIERETAISIQARLVVHHVAELNTALNTDLAERHSAPF